MLRAALILWAALTTCLHAQDIIPAPYAQLKTELDGIVTFDALPRRPEPGINFDENIYFAGLWLGEHFAGQQLGRGPNGHDALLSGTPNVPLIIRPGQPRKNQSVAFHWGYGSNALFPLGPDGFDDITGRGEGAVALLFDHDQHAIGLRLHTHYDAPLGNAPDLGQLTVLFFARNGTLIDRITVKLSPTVVELGWRHAQNHPDIAGMLILNTDPGGIAVDDILFQRTPALG